LAKAVEVLQQEIGYSNVEALGETLQNIVNNNTAQQVEGLPSNEVAEKLNKAYQQLDLTSYSSEEIRRMIQFTFLKAAKEDGLQMNHQMTPDAIGLLVAYMIDQMTKKDESLQIADFAAGSGNLLSTILLFLQSAGKTASATAIDNDEVLVHLALQAFALEQLDVKTSLQDGLQDSLVDPQDFVVSDLPVGFYPDDNIATRYEVASRQEHTYAHHLLMEQSLKYLKTGGYAIFLAPTDLLTSPQSELLKSLLTEKAQLVAIIALPEDLFAHGAQSKTIFVLQKKTGEGIEPFVYPLTSLRDPEILMEFKENFQNWCQEHEI